jgi:hypothetical protein
MAFVLNEFQSARKSNVAKPETWTGLDKIPILRAWRRLKYEQTKRQVNLAFLCREPQSGFR